METIKIITMICGVAALILGVYIVGSRLIRNRKSNSRHFLENGKFVSAEDFIKRCGKSKSGSIDGDGPGCYVIKVFSNPTDNPNEGNLYDILIGTSEKMGKTVYDGLTGNGDQRMYDNFRRSKSIFIKFIGGSADKLDELEAKVCEEHKEDIAKVEKKHSPKAKKSKKKH